MSVCFGSGGRAVSMAVDPSVTASLQMIDVKYLCPAAKTRTGHLLFCDIHCFNSNVKHSQTEIQNKLNYPTVGLLSVKAVSWCTGFRSGKILLTLLMVKLVLISISGIRLLNYILWENMVLASHYLNDRSLVQISQHFFFFKKKVVASISRLLQ